jgi:HD superfamily phosphohydrolase
LEAYREGLTEEVAAIFRSETSPDIYSSIVSSQFDADRLDYMRRDRFMTGTQAGGIDFTWLLSNLEVASIEVGSDEKSFGKIDTFVLGPKAGWAGESYVLSLFHLYPTIYLHKATRGAEKLFGRLLTCLDEKVKENALASTGLPESHPLVAYLRERKLASYLELDDTSLWGALSLLAQASCKEIAHDAQRLRDRRLLKAIDIRSSLSDGRLYPGAEIAQLQLAFRRGLADLTANDATLVKRILIDRYERDPYKRKGYESPKAIERIHVLSKGHVVDLAEISPVVAALKPLEIFRVYVSPEDEEAKALVLDLIERVKK